MKLANRVRLTALLLTILIDSAISTGTANAQAMRTPTLDRIREYGAIFVGHREASSPFSYFNGDEAIGYSVDLCHKIVDAVRVHLNDPSIKEVMVPITSTGRVNAVVSGMIDLECGSTTNTSIRKQTIDFSVTTFVTGVKAMVRMDSGINQWSDLDGKVMITTAGTISERTAKSALAKKNITMRTITGRTHPDSFNQVLKKTADAYINDDVLISNQIANSPDGEKLKLLPQNFAFEPYAIGFRKDDPEFKKLVNDTLIGLMKSGEIKEIYKKWFMSPIPPYDTSLKVPMSSLLEEAIEAPSDIGIN